MPHNRSWAFWYTLSSYISISAGNCVSARSIFKKESGFPATAALASSRLYTSYGSAAIFAAFSLHGRMQRNGLISAMVVLLWYSDCDMIAQIAASHKGDNPDSTEGPSFCYYNPTMIV